AGGFHTCALPGDGIVLCWGQNDLGQLGNGTVSPTANTPNPTPVSVSGITTAVAVAAGGWHTCALLQDGSIRCWGDNTWGQLGNGSPDGVVSTIPSAPVTGITAATAASSGAEHTCALLQDGSLQCWGAGKFGRLGNGTITDAFTPVAVTGFGGVTWTSSDTNVATIDANGLATSRNPGSTTMIATSGDRSGSTTLTVV